MKERHITKNVERELLDASKRHHVPRVKHTLPSSLPTEAAFRIQDDVKSMKEVLVHYEEMNDYISQFNGADFNTLKIGDADCSEELQVLRFDSIQAIHSILKKLKVEARKHGVKVPIHLSETCKDYLESC